MRENIISFCNEYRKEEKERIVFKVVIYWIMEVFSSGKNTRCLVIYLASEGDPVARRIKTTRKSIILIEFTVKKTIRGIQGKMKKMFAVPLYRKFCVWNEITRMMVYRYLNCNILILCIGDVHIQCTEEFQLI